MKNVIKILMVGAVLLCANVALADAVDTEVQKDLKRLVRDGRSVSEAVKTLLTEYPDRSEDVVRAAILLWPTQIQQALASAISSGVAPTMAVKGALRANSDLRVVELGAFQAGIAPDVVIKVAMEMGFMPGAVLAAAKDAGLARIAIAKASLDAGIGAPEVAAILVENGEDPTLVSPEMIGLSPDNAGDILTATVYSAPARRHALETSMPAGLVDETTLNSALAVGKLISVPGEVTLDPANQAASSQRENPSAKARGKVYVPNEPTFAPVGGTGGADPASPS